MITKLLFIGAATMALLSPFANASSVDLSVTESGAFQGGAIGGLNLPGGDNSFSTSFTSNTSNVNVTTSPTFFGVPNAAKLQGTALGEFIFTDSASSVTQNLGPTNLNMNVTVGSSSTTLTFDGSLVTSSNNLCGGTKQLCIVYTPQAGQFTESFYDSTYNVWGTYVMQDFDGYAFGVLESTLAESGAIDSGKQVGIDGIVTTAGAAAPEPGTLFSMGLTGLGLLAVGLKKRSKTKA